MAEKLVKILGTALVEALAIVAKELHDKKKLDDEKLFDTEDEPVDEDDDL